MPFKLQYNTRANSKVHLPSRTDVQPAKTEATPETVTDTRERGNRSTVLSYPSIYNVWDLKALGMYSLSAQCRKNIHFVYILPYTFRCLAVILEMKIGRSDGW